MHTCMIHDLHLLDTYYRVTYARKKEDDKKRREALLVSFFFPLSDLILPLSGRVCCYPIIEDNYVRDMRYGASLPIFSISADKTRVKRPRGLNVPRDRPGSRLDKSTSHRDGNRSLPAAFALSDKPRAVSVIDKKRKNCAHVKKKKSWPPVVTPTWSWRQPRDKAFSPVVLARIIRAGNARAYSRLQLSAHSIGDALD